MREPKVLEEYLGIYQTDIVKKLRKGFHEPDLLVPV